MFNKYILANGLRVILIPQKQSLAATVLVLVKAGSEYETKDQNGISHFLEHLVFKGTKRRPKPGDLSRELESLGAEYNAFTGHEWTMYYAKSEKHNLNKILDLISDMYLDPIFEPAEIEKEKGVIIEEINLYEDTPSRRVQEIFSRLLYGDQPAGWDIAGRKDVVRRLCRDDFVKYRAKHYVPSGTVVVVSGAFSEAFVKKQIKNTFGKLPKTPRASKPKTTQSQNKPALVVQFKDSEQSHLVVGVRACDIFDPRRHAIRVLAEILGGGMSSRLFTRVREQMGAAYYVRAEEEFLLDHGYFAVSAGVEIRKIKPVISAILEEMAKLREEVVPAAELQKAKGHLIGGLILGLETSDDLAGFYGAQDILTDKPASPEEIIRRINAVTPAQIREVARTFFVEKNLNLAVIGPYKESLGFRNLLTLLKS